MIVDKVMSHSRVQLESAPFDALPEFVAGQGAYISTDFWPGREYVLVSLTVLATVSEIENVCNSAPVTTLAPTEFVIVNGLPKPLATSGSTLSDPATEKATQSSPYCSRRDYRYSYDTSDAPAFFERERVHRRGMKQERQASHAVENEHDWVHVRNQNQFQAFVMDARTGVVQSGQYSRGVMGSAAGKNWEAGLEEALCWQLGTR